MADKKISELTELTAPDGAEELVVNDSGVSKKITQANLFKLGDNVKAKFGASDDLQIYHDGGHSYITDSGTGNLNIRGTSLSLSNAGASQHYVVCTDGGASTVYHAGNAKLATTATGVDVTGSVTCDGFTSTGIDDNATSTAITIDASENVILEKTLETGNSFTGGYAIKFNNTASQGGMTGFIYDNNQDNLEITAYDPSYALTFKTSNLERMRIDSAGNVEVKTGNLVIGTSGKGIDFSAGGNAAGMTSEVLDDYEEGTWTITITPATSGTVTVNSGINTGHYTKVGSLVTVHGQITISAVDAPVGNASINLPFTVGTGTEKSAYSAGAVGTHLVNWASGASLLMRSGTGSAAALLLSYGDGIAWALVTADAFSANSELCFSFSYNV